MKILIFGKTGQVGSELIRSCAVVGEVVGVSSQEVNLTDSDAISKCIRAVRPNIVVNAAAYTNVEKAESERELADAINSDAVGVIGQVSKEVGAKVIHFSTDYVFDGTKSSAYLESDSTKPINAYGKSKLKGEVLLKESGVEYVILRVSWIYSNYGNNFYKTMKRLGRQKNELGVVSDQWGAPTWARNIADVVAQICRQGVTKENSGIYHLTPQGETTWHHFAKEIFQSLREQGMGDGLVVQAVNPIATADFATKAIRPLNSRMDSQKIYKQFGLRLPNWKVSLAEVVKEYSQIVLGDSK